MPFVTYAYYTSQAGGVLPEEVFSRLIGRACAYVQYMTLGKGHGDTDGEKLAACRVLEVYADGESQRENGRAIRSENNDGYSGAYVTEQRDGESWEEVLSRKAYQAARPYLLSTGLLYRGVNQGGNR